MQPPTANNLAFRSYYFRGTNTNIILLLNLAVEAEKSGFPRFAQYLLQEAFQRLEQKLEGLEREIEQEEKAQ